jgi:hypothetical protein
MDDIDSVTYLSKTYVDATVSLNSYCELGMKLYPTIGDVVVAASKLLARSQDPDISQGNYELSVAANLEYEAKNSVMN